MISNYEQMKWQMQVEFLKYNQEDMIKRFSLTASETYLLFDFMGGSCRIHRKSGLVETSYGYMDGFCEANYNEAMTVYDLLCWSRPDAVSSGRFVNMQSISPMQNGTSRLGTDFFRQEARLFDHQEESLRTSLEKLGGIADESGDVAARIPVFRGLNVLFRFWNSDDEFVSEIQFLWDERVLDFMHYETVWFANHVLVRRVKDIFDKTNILREFVL